EAAAADRLAQRVLGPGPQRAAGGGVEVEVEVHLAPSLHTGLDLDRGPSRAYGPAHGPLLLPSPVGPDARAAGPGARGLRPRDDRRDPRRGAGRPPRVRRRRPALRHPD